MTARQPAGTAQRRLVVLTLNTHKGFTPFNRRFVLHELREAAVGTHADIVFLQEVIGQHELHSLKHRNWPSRPHYEFFAESIWRDFAYGKNAVYPAGHHGNAVLSKFPILAHRNHDVSIGTLERRGLLHCRIVLPDAAAGEIHVICAHLALRGADRLRQLALLTQLIRDAVPPRMPLVVAGDFNDWREEAAPLLAQGSGLLDVFAAVGGRVPRTFPARLPLLRLDRIYVRDLTVLAARVHAMRPWSHLSDHAALSAELRA
jgi:endonuclease/exonuclease/phosphatase family metal-dependent hydrolase